MLEHKIDKNKFVDFCNGDVKGEDTETLNQMCIRDRAVSVSNKTKQPANKKSRLNRKERCSMGINGVSSYANTYTYGNVKNENVKPSKNSEKNYYAGYTMNLSIIHI